jgi:AbrB family looped-hinge helix DNA binding protein
MREFLSSVSPKGQITLPIEIRRQLGVMPKDSVSMRLEGDTVTVRPASFTLAQVFGSVEPAAPTDAFKAMELSAREERAEREVRRRVG